MVSVFFFPKCVEEEGGDRRLQRPQNQELSWTQKKLKEKALGRRVMPVVVRRGPLELRQAGLASGWEARHKPCSDQPRGDVEASVCCSA